MSKLTPQEAFEFFSRFYPETTSISIHDKSCVKVAYDLGRCNAYLSGEIDWPEGVTEWPIPQTWEVPSLPDDFEKSVRFRDNSGQKWRRGVLVGHNKLSQFPWIVRESGDNSSTCIVICEIDRNKYPRTQAT